MGRNMPFVMLCLHHQVACADEQLFGLTLDKVNPTLPPVNAEL